MPEHVTANFGLPYPAGVGEVRAGAEDFRELAEALDVKPFLKIRYSDEATLNAGYDELLETTNANKIILPAAGGAGKGRVIGILFQGGGTGFLKVEGASIWGLRYAGAKVVELTKGDSLFLVSDNTNWVIVGGSASSWPSIPIFSKFGVQHEVVQRTLITATVRFTTPCAIPITFLVPAGAKWSATYDKPKAAAFEEPNGAGGGTFYSNGREAGEVHGPYPADVLESEGLLGFQFVEAHV